MRGLYPTSQTEADETRRTLERIAKPAPAQWVAQRVVTLLTHYFIAEAHPAALKQIAEDWIDELAEFPEWAIEAACRWWVGRENERRSRKPLPGDISDRAAKFMAPVHAGRAKVAAFERYGNKPPAFLAND